MNFKITNIPSESLDAQIENGLEQYNRRFSSGEFEKLSVYCENDDGQLVGGMTGISYGKWLHISDLWVDESFRNRTIGSKVLSKAENEAVKRGCTGVTLDTYSFQALDFYLKCGYSEFGVLDGYAGKYKRHYLKKDLTNKSANKEI